MVTSCGVIGGFLAIGSASLVLQALARSCREDTRPLPVSQGSGCSLCHAKYSHLSISRRMLSAAIESIDGNVDGCYICKRLHICRRKYTRKVPQRLEGFA